MNNFILFRWLRSVSIAKKLYFTVGIMALLIATELVTLWFAINTLSSVRAYVEGEGLWSKAQKDAAYELTKYYRTHDETDYIAFQNFMKVSRGDHKARLELVKENPDWDVARQGFLEGRNHPNDIDNMITLFRRFHDISYINKAISIWAAADPYATELSVVGEKLHAEITAASPSKERIDTIIQQVEPINKQVTALEDDFSYTLGEGSRWLENLILKLLFAVALTVEVSGLLLTISVSRGIAKGIGEIVSASKSIAKGDFNRKAKAFSQDEIGILANSFNQMSDDLKEQRERQSRADEDLKRQKELYETLVNAQSEMGEGVTITEGQKIIYANLALCKMYGYNEDEILSMPSFMDIVIPEDKERLTKRFQQRLSGEEKSDTGETAIMRKDGQIINIEYSLKSIKTGTKTQLVSIIRDISDKIKAQKALALHSEELKQINKELEQFAYVASHDLQEPLRSVISYLQIIEDRYKGKIDSNADEFIHFAVDGANRMHQLIKDLLTYSRIGNHNVPFEQVDFKNVLDITLKDLNNTIVENNATVSYDHNLPVINADPMQIGLLFQNLIGNAIKFKGKTAPNIVVSSHENNSHWKFSVKDNGIGISKEFAQRVFIIFQRLHTREQYPGTGIGLAVCKKIVERHGGNIWLESEEGKGSTFYFTIKKT